MPYFWFRDSHSLINTEFTVCFEHSQRLLIKLMEKEDGYKRLIKQLYDKIEHKRGDLNKGSNIAEERQKIKDAKMQGLTVPKFKKYDEIKKEIDDLYKKAKSFRNINNFERNKVCRGCGFPLAEPEFDSDQISNNYSHSDWHSDKGFRREVILYHTACGREWIANNMILDEKIKIQILPKSDRQHTLEETFNELEPEPILYNTNNEVR